MHAKTKLKPQWHHTITTLKHSSKQTKATVQPNAKQANHTHENQANAKLQPEYIQTTTQLWQHWKPNRNWTKATQIAVENRSQTAL